MINNSIQSLIQHFLPDFTEIGSLINGEIVLGTGEEIQLYRAHDASLLLSFRDADPSIIATLDQVAHQAQQQWQQQTAAQRGRILFQVAQLIRQQAEYLAQVECLTSNKPINDAKGEVLRVAEMFEYYAGWTDKLHGEVIPVPTSHLNYVRYEPIGTVFQITPWNAPIFTCGWQLAPALAAGNAVILKPSELTPVSSILVAKIIELAGAPKGLVNVIAGYGHSIGQAIIAQADIGKVCFVGSPQTGRHIASAAAARCIPCVLELGGKSANIIFEDANLDQARQGAMAAIFGGAGQSCVSGSRLLVQDSIFETFVAQLATASQKIKVGNPESPSIDIGPINNRKQFEHVCHMLNIAQQEGATIAGNTQPILSDEGFYIQPTVLVGNNEMRCAQEEIFGPVVVAIPFKDEEDAVRIANQSNFGLAGAVWTNDVARAHRVAASVKAGTFWINSYKTIHVSSPFGGYKQSGYGRSSGLDALREYSEVKSVWVETANQPTFSFKYGPSEG